MPRLILEARRVASTVIHGLHGRRRAGPGENFWQYRRFVSGEPAQNVDWRRSARDDHLYVREREWEASHTVWIWPDRSPSMNFTSALSTESKLDRALVISFALAEVLVQGGERVGVPGLMRPSASRNVIEKMAEAILHDPTERASLPPSFVPSPLSEVVMLSDLWAPIGEVRHTIAQLVGDRRPRPCCADRRSGRRKLSLFRPRRIYRAGRRRQRYRRTRRDVAQRLSRHRCAPSRRYPRRNGFARLDFRHPSYRQARKRALAGAAFAHGRQRPAGRHQQPARAGKPSERRMIGSLPLGFAQPLVLLGLLSLPVLWWLLRLVPPRPRRIDFPPTRLLFEIAPKEETPARTPWWLTLLRLMLAALVIVAAAGPLWNPPLATADRAAPLLILLDDGWPAASTWDARLRTADEMIARAEADDRGVAVLADVGDRARYFAANRRRRARSDQTDQAETSRGRPHGGAAGDRALSLQAPRMSKSSGFRMVSISARVPISLRD